MPRTNIGEGACFFEKKKKEEEVEGKEDIDKFSSRNRTVKQSFFSYRTI